MMIVNNSKSILAKLLAKENINIVHGNYRTAFFDVEKRTLGLPLWDNLKDVYDLLVGHEVGHALETPPEGWHDANVEIPGCPRSYINVVEDVRIEKLIQRRYPGLVSCFKRGYQKLYDDDFFGVSEIPELTSDYVNLIDRINLKAKLRELISVEFLDSERDLVNEVFAVETWEDVLEACRKLYAYALENQTKSPSMPNNSNEEQNENMDPTAEAAETSSNKPRSMDDNAEGEEKNKKGASSSNEETEEQNESDEVEEKSSEGGNDYDQSESQTDKAFRENEHKLLSQDENGRMVDVCNGFTKAQLNDMIIGYRQVEAARDKLESEVDHTPRWNRNSTSPSIENAFIDFMNENKKVVQIMSKEFEMRKAAWRSSRAQTARSGSLDVNKLYSYKYTDDIFKRMTNLPDAKNHGMFMLVDYSGSMNNTLSSVIKQIVVLSMFCRKVNIPYEVMGFTTRRGEAGDPRTVPYGHVDHTDVRLFTVASSSLNKPDQDKCIRQMYNNAYRLENGCWPTQSSAEELGGTPLDEALIAMPHLIEKFTKKYNIQKTNFVLLTDGAGSRLYTKRHEKEMEIDSCNRAGYAINIMGNLVKTNSNTKLTKALLNNLKKHYCSSITGYFLANARHDFNYALTNANSKISWDDTNLARRKFMKEKYFALDNVLGYDRYFILRNDRKSLDTTTEDFEVRDNAKKGEIARAFKKFANSKKANRTLAVKFAETVA
tara:strand:+ start:17162 stop:19312 length:2151 start_codon:yes stop_codon:yes gene_type:complete